MNVSVCISIKHIFKIRSNMILVFVRTMSHFVISKMYIVFVEVNDTCLCDSFIVIVIYICGLTEKEMLMIT
jgi:hypothetical protein